MSTGAYTSIHSWDLVHHKRKEKIDFKKLFVTRHKGHCIMIKDVTSS